MSKRPKTSTDGFVRTSGVNYAKLSDRHVDDDRHERPQAGMSKNPSTGTTNVAAAKGDGGAGGGSAAMDSVMRLMTGQQERGIRDKLNDANRPTWDQYKKDNKDKLDLVGEDKRKMEEYRKELDRAREERLSRGLNHGAKKAKKEKKDKKDKKKKHKKDKKEKKSKKVRRDEG